MVKRKVADILYVKEARVMSAEQKNPDTVKVRFPIGAKLLLIISLISLVSLGALTMLASALMGQDVQITAEENNYTINRYAASEAGESLASVRSGANVLLNIIENSGARADLAAAWFFDEYPNIAAVVSSETVLANQRFFARNGIEPRRLEEFLAAGEEAAELAGRGAVVLRNGGPIFGFPLLALFYPWKAGAAAVIFSSEYLSDSFGTGINSTWMINDKSDILVHPNGELPAAGASAANHPLVRALRESPAVSQQTLFTGEDGTRWFGAYTKLGLGNAAVVTVVEYERVFEGVAATTRRNIYLTVAVLFISGILILLFSRTISRPIQGLTRGVRLIEGGEFDVSIKAAARDEIGVLAESFTRMSKALAIFGRFTNREIAVSAMRGGIKTGGLPKHATVFFSDIRGFTEKSENFTKAFGDEAPGRIVHWLNEYFTRMVECVTKTGGVVDKFIGDAVMAHWGTAYTAGSPEKDAFNCVKTALMMRRALTEMNRDRRLDDPANPPIRIGCGINTGVVIAGQIGSDERMEYTVIGDPVNLASRTEALNKPLGTDILITESTWALIGKHLLTEEMPPVKVKGKKDPVRIFAVINVAPGAKGPYPGPQSLPELRALLGIAPPDLSQVDFDAEEKKYELGE
jgi:adenylate cyclase